jgi:hypothetical protein
MMTAILIVEDDILANEHLEFILQHAGARKMIEAVRHFQ